MTDTFVPRTERSYWADIAAALNAATEVGMPVGIDLDGTLTDHNAWSVVWDRSTGRWTVAGYDSEKDTRGGSPQQGESTHRHALPCEFPEVLPCLCPVRPADVPNSWAGAA